MAEMKKVTNNDLQNTTQKNMMSGIAYPSGAPEFTPVFCGVCVAQSLFFCVVFCRSLFVPFFISAIVLYVLLLFTASDYPFGILNSDLSLVLLRYVLTTVNIKFI
jgi:hypothetical protein